MLNLSELRVRIEVMLDNGVYVFDDQSAIGKTRLAKELKKYKMAGYPVDSYTFSDYVDGRDISSVLNENTRLVLIDRYDMYDGYGADIMSRFKDSAIILIDSKQNVSPVSVDDYWCTIKMTPNRIEVYTV